MAGSCTCACGVGNNSKGNLTPVARGNCRCACGVDMSKGSLFASVVGGRLGSFLG
jgi:formylmethanofuran dehydrogenase subunit C